MIEKQNLGGEYAIVAYLDKAMQPVTKDKAKLVKVTFENSGRVLFLVPRSPDGADFVRNNVKMWG